MVSSSVIAVIRLMLSLWSSLSQLHLVSWHLKIFRKHITDVLNSVLLGRRIRSITLGSFLPRSLAGRLFSSLLLRALLLVCRLVGTAPGCRGPFAGHRVEPRSRSLVGKGYE